MPVKPEVISEFFGYDPEKFDNDEAFKEAAAKEWTKVSEAVNSKELQSAITGRMNAAIITEMKKIWKENELPTDGIKWDEAKPSEMVGVLAGTLGKKFTEREASLTEKLKSKGSEEANKEWERKYGEVEKKVKEYEGVNSTLRGEIEKRDRAEKERELNGKIEASWNTAKSSLKFKQGMSDLEKAGFDTEARKRFQVRFDENGESYWAGQDGNRIPDGSKHQAFKDGAQLLKDLAKELKVDESNPRGGTPVGQRQPPKEEVNKPLRSRIIATPGRVLHDNIPGQ